MQIFFGAKFIVLVTLALRGGYVDQILIRSQIANIGPSWYFPLHLSYNQKHLLSGFDEIDANEAHSDHEKEVGQSSWPVHPTQLVNISSLDHMDGDVRNWESLRQVPTQRLTEVTA